MMGKVEDRPTGGNAKLRAKLDACQLAVQQAQLAAELAAVRKADVARGRYRETLETWLMLMELERNAKKFRWEEAGNDE